LSGVVSIIASIVVLAWPFDSIVIMALVVGIWLIIIGVMEMVAGFSMRRDVKKAEHTITGARPDARPADVPPRPAV
jgi:hypothetical protein